MNWKEASWVDMKNFKLHVSQKMYSWCLHNLESLFQCAAGQLNIQIYDFCRRECNLTNVETKKMILEYLLWLEYALYEYK